MIYQRASDGALVEGYPQSFGPKDLHHLGAVLSRAKAVVPMRSNAWSPGVVSLRHDVDHNLEHALRFARWEARQGFRASYFLLHTAWYWKPDIADGIAELQDLGHEVGLHHDAVAEAWRRGYTESVDGSVLPGGDCVAAALVFGEALDELRSLGANVSGVSCHGTPLWKTDHITNAFLWAAGYRPEDFGLEYEAYHRHRGTNYISDNRGQWSKSLALDAERPTHLLVHPCHWKLP